jgi:hypothetical protein
MTEARHILADDPDREMREMAQAENDPRGATGEARGGPSGFC